MNINTITEIKKKYIISDRSICETIAVSYYGRKGIKKKDLKFDLYDENFYINLSNYNELIYFLLKSCIKDLNDIIIHKPKGSYISINFVDKEDKKIILSIEELRYLILVYLEVNLKRRPLDEIELVDVFFNKLTQQYFSFFSSLNE